MKRFLTLASLTMGLTLGSAFAQKGKSLVLNGTDQAMLIPNHPDFNVSASESFTVSAYIKVKGWGSNLRFLAKRLDKVGEFKSGYEFWGANGSGGRQFLACNIPNTSGKYDNSFSVWTGKGANIDTWVHFAWVVDRSKNKMFFYQDGELCQTSGNKDVSKWIENSPYDIIVGARMNGAEDEFNYYFKGEIDNLRFWKRALSEAELKADMSADVANGDRLVAAYDFENIRGKLVPDVSNSVNKHNGRLLPDSYKVKQITDLTGRGNTNQKIVGLTVSGEGQSAKLRNLTVSMEGTTDIADVAKLRVLIKNNKYKYKEVGSADVKEGEIIIPLDNEVKIIRGSNTLYLAYDVKKTALEGHQLDGRIISLETTEGVLNVKSKGNPKGSREILLARKRIFAPGDYGSKNYRIPAIITAKDGSLIVLTDKRKNNEADLPQDIDVVVRRSTDNGLTWSDPVTIAEGKGYGKGYGDAAVVMAQDGTLITTFVGGVGLWGGPGNITRTYISKSTDNGITWTAPIDITDQLYGPNCPSNENRRKEWVGVFCASGNGFCTRSGRIMFVACARVNKGSLDNYLFYSDDLGKTWNVSGKAKVSGDEAKVIELENGDLLMSIRHGGAGSGTKPRPWVLSKDGGKTWTESGSWAEVLDPACNGDIIYYTSKHDGYKRNRILHSIPYSTRGARENVSVLLSYDEGKTWPIRTLISKGPSAYSSICKLKDGTIGVYVEESDPTTARGYSLYFINVSLSWLTNGKDRYRDPNSKDELLKSPVLSLDPSKTYTKPVKLSISHPDENVTLYYTLDGTTPTTESPVYVAPIKLNKSTRVSVLACKDGGLESEVVVADYVIDLDTEGTVTAVEDIQSSLKVYASNKILYVKGLKAPAKGSIYSIKGELVKQLVLNEQNNAISLNLEQGIYFIKIESAQGIKVFKLLVKA